MKPIRPQTKCHMVKKIRNDQLGLKYITTITTTTTNGGAGGQD